MTIIEIRPFRNGLLGTTVFHSPRGNGKRFVVRSDEKLTAFLELERITHELALSTLLGDDSN
jgi:hypothetical protein